MSFNDLAPFLIKAVAAVRDTSALQLAWQAAGHYGKDHPMKRCFHALARTPADRALLAELMLRSSDYAVTLATAFVEEHIGKNLVVAIMEGGETYNVDGTDMLQSWFGALCEEWGTITPKAMVEEIDRVERGGVVSPLPKTKDER